jgi:hypothetical protein
MVLDDPLGSAGWGVPKRPFHQDRSQRRQDRSQGVGPDYTGGLCPIDPTEPSQLKPSQPSLAEPSQAQPSPAEPNRAQPIPAQPRRIQPSLAGPA